MNKDKQIQIHEARQELVVKSNELIRNTRYDLTVSEQRTLIYLISRICADDKDFKHVELTVSEYCDLIDIEKSGREYSRVKACLKNLSDKSWWLPTEDGGERLFRWVDTATVNKGKIDIVLSESLKPYLLDIKANFTKYELINTILLHSKYSIRLYELFQSYLWLHSWKVSMEEIRDILQIGNKYPVYADFKKRVLEPSVREINKYTNLQISYKGIKPRKKIEAIEFTIKEKEGQQQLINLLLNQEERIGI